MGTSFCQTFLEMDKRALGSFVALILPYWVVLGQHIGPLSSGLLQAQKFEPMALLKTQSKVYNIQNFKLVDQGSRNGSRNTFFVSGKKHWQDFYIQHYF